jgi:peptide/nickel transport system permease protein
MVPMLFGISLVNFAIITFAEPPRSSRVSEKGDFDRSSSMEANEAEHIFRQTFFLDRPRFWNARYGIEDEEVLWHLASTQRAWELPKERHQARYALDDYGRVIVPHLLRIAGWAIADRAPLREGPLRQAYEARWRVARRAWVDEGRPPGDIEWPPPAEAPPFDDAFCERLGTLALDRLANNAPRRPEVVYGKISPEVQARNREVRLEQVLLRGIFLDRAATDAQKLARWKEWADERRDEWEYTREEKVRMLFLETRFAKFWENLLSFDLGTSFVHRKKVWTLIGERIHVSLILSFGSLLLAYLIAIPLGILSAATHRSRSDVVLTTLLFAAYSLPTMFLGVLFVKYFAIERKWFPVAAFEGPDHESLTVLGKMGDVAWHVALPMAAMTIVYLALYSRYMKSGLIEIIRADYIRTARAKGLRELTVVLKHAVRNGLIPIITLLGASFPVILGGSVIIEYIFQIDGMGKLAYDSVQKRDYGVILGLNILTAVLTMIGVFLADLAYAVADPRIRYR